MKELGQIPLCVNFLQNDEIKRIFSLLGRSMFVGGCVRDSLLGSMECFDIDIATETKPEETLKILKSAGFKVIPTGLAHGTVTVVLDPYNIEITTLRYDRETDGRFAVVEFSEDWVGDAMRRDFRINALYSDINGVVYDPFNGQGFDDLSKRAVVFIGFPDDRIAEDSLRILRYFRFYSRFGGTPNRDAVGACRRNASKIKNLSSERIAKEIRKILMVSSPENTILLMRSCEVLQQITDFKPDIDYLRQIVWLETHGIKFDEVNPNAMRRIIAMFQGNESEISMIANFLKFSNKEKTFLKQTIQAMKNKDVKINKYEFGFDAALSSLLLNWAKDRAENPMVNTIRTQNWHNQVREVIDFIPPQMPVSGKDLLDLGLSPSEKFNKLLKMAEESFIVSNFILSKEELLAEIKKDF